MQYPRTDHTVTAAQQQDPANGSPSEQHLFQSVQLIYSRGSPKRKDVEPVELCIAEGAVFVFIHNIKYSIERPDRFGSQTPANMMVERHHRVYTCITCMLKDFGCAVWMHCRALVIPSQVYGLVHTRIKLLQIELCLRYFLL